MTMVDDDCLNIIETSQDRKDRLDDALTRNGKLEQQNSELQAIVDNGGLISRRSSMHNRDFVATLMEQNRTLEAALIQEEQADFEKDQMI